MAAHKLRTDQQRDAVRADIAARYKAGATQTAIGAALGLTQQQISYYLKGLLLEWRTEAGAAIDAKLQQELAKLDWLEAEAAREYERSKKPIQKRQVVTETGKIEGSGGLPNDVVRTTETTEGRLGDPHYLDIIDRCVDRRLRIFGLYAQGESTATVLIKAYNGLDLERL